MHPGTVFWMNKDNIGFPILGQKPTIENRVRMERSAVGQDTPKSEVEIASSLDYTGA
ncbi:unnamed protein product, partial [Rangifer tarandus platyrhynchus]